MAYHVQLSRGLFRSGHLFNLDADELGRLVVEPLRAGRAIELEDKIWPPLETRVAIREGPPLSTDQLALGQGWRNATSSSRDVTAAWLEAPGGSPAADGAGGSDPRSVAVLGGASAADLEALAGFLRALGLEPAFPPAEAAAGGAAALVAEALRTHRALVLLLGGEQDERHSPSRPAPDLLVAAGLAAGAGGARAVIAVLGALDGGVPLSTLGAVRLGGPGESPQRELAARLERAGCAVAPPDERWLEPLRFTR